MIKVLWFTPTPSLAEGYLQDGPVGGGWIKSLEKEIRAQVRLSVCFYYHRQMAAFVHEGTTYFPIKRYSDKPIRKVVKKILGTLESRHDIQSFKKVVDEVQPDVIHIHGTEFPYGLIQNSVQVPAIVSIQGNIVVYKHKFFSGLSLVDVLRFTRIKSWLTFNSQLNFFSRFKRQAKRELEIFKMSSHFIGRTSWDQRVCKILSPRAKYFHNDEILRDSFYENQWANSLHGELELITTTGSTLYKGMETVVHCASLLDGYGLKFKWRVVGVNRQDELVRMALKGSKVKLSPHVHFEGKLSEDELVGKLLNAHLYIGASHIENSPNSLCEAQLLGLPCIATYAGGTSSLMTDGVDGILVQDGDPYSLAGAIIEMQENYSRAQEYGSNARVRAMKRHDRIAIAQSLLEIYHQLEK